MNVKFCFLFCFVWACFLIFFQAGRLEYVYSFLQPFLQQKEDHGLQKGNFNDVMERFEKVLLRTLS